MAVAVHLPGRVAHISDGTHERSVQRLAVAPFFLDYTLALESIVLHASMSFKCSILFTILGITVIVMVVK